MTVAPVVVAENTQCPGGSPLSPPRSSVSSGHREEKGAARPAAAVEGREPWPSAQEKLGLWIKVSLRAIHAGAARAQMGAGSCPCSSLEWRVHTSAYMFLSSFVAGLLAPASPTFLRVPLRVDAEGGEDQTAFPLSPTMSTTWHRPGFPTQQGCPPPLHPTPPHPRH